MQTKQHCMEAMVVSIGLVLLGAVPLTAALVGFWDFNEGSGTTALDKSGNGNNGALIGSVSYVPGPPSLSGTALSFDGSTGHVNVGNESAASVLSLTGTSYTIMLWVKPAASSALQLLINKDSMADNYGGYDIWVQDSDHPWLAHNNGGPNNYNGTAYGMVVPTNTWTHLAVVYDMTSGIRMFYMSGVLISTATLSITGPLLARGTDPLWFGAWVNGGSGGYYFNGSMDDVRIYNEALSQADIWTYLGINSKLVGYWNFNEGSGTVALDKSGWGNNGTLHGGATYVADSPPKWTGASLSFNGTDAYVDIASNTFNSALSLTGTSYTIMLWVKPAASSGLQLLINKDSMTDYYGGYDVYLDSSEHHPWLIHQNNNGGANSSGYTSTVIPTNTWTHLAEAYDMASETRSFYTNGVLVATATGLTGPLLARGTDPLWFGAVPVYGYYFKGQMDEVRIYSAALSQAEIAAAMAPVPPKGTVIIVR